ncbi:stage II sporulation protein M [Candidatus Woesearchaeota archaeon]|nr:stage II sporulation protein M [Candidatus Woesearchaeota archaeon]
MVLEALINPLQAEKKPWQLFFFGFMYTSIAILVSLWVFEAYATLLMVFLVVIAVAPLMYKTLLLEEQKDVELAGGEQGLLKEHAKAILFLTVLFLGITAAFAFWYVLLPQSLVTVLFTAQTQTIASVNTKVTGDAISSTSLFQDILLNNIKVLLFCLLFSFVYGFGAIFILTWNASVIGAAMGNIIKSKLAAAAGLVGMQSVSHYLSVVSFSFLRYLVHGIPEIVAYFVAALAGGIISTAVVRHDFGTPQYYKILMDSVDLVLIALGLLVLGAVMEVYLTPLLI